MALAGLVSYDTSDESENESENETETTALSKTEPIQAKLYNGPSCSGINSAQNSERGSEHLDNLIDDEAVDDSVIVGPSVPTGLALPKPKYTENDNGEIGDYSSKTVSDTDDDVTKGLASLPKASSSSSGFIGTLDDEVEEEFRKLPKNAELPKPVKKSQSGKVKITLPDLPTYDSDEDDEPKAKKPKPASSGKSGLIGMLPQPKNFTVKETNRPLVPHTLTNKSKAQVKPKAKPTSASVKPKLVDVGSDDSEDDNDEGQNFFSLSDKKNDEVRIRGDTVRILPTTTTVEAKPMVVEPTEAPLAFRNSSTTIAATHKNYTGTVGPSRPSAYSESSGQEYPSNEDYYGHDAQYPSASSTSSVDFATHQKLIQDEQFKRMVGKNFRDAEMIDIMDVHADDQMATQIDITKSLSEEKSNVSYSKKRKDLPSRLSRQKHQITYLAFQAKERELELKNQWSQNKMTKRQTQAKYGF